MKKNGVSHALLSPGATGWRIRVTGAEASNVSTLEEAIASIPANAHIELTLPCQSVLLERHKLPATDRTEIADMLQLQLEKTLPFPVEEVTHGYELLDQAENESTILSISAHHAQLDQICAPLRENGMLPERITLEAQRMAVGCPKDETVLAVWPEQDQLTVAIVANGKLAWAQPIGGRDPEFVLGELPGLLISAELEGVPVEFTSVRLSPECSDLEPSLAEHFQKPVFPLAEPETASDALDLLPVSWQHEARSRERGEKLKQNLLLAAVVYLILVAGAFVFLAYYKKQVQNAQVEVLNTAPKYAMINQQMARWNTFAPAIDKARYPLDVMLQLWSEWGGNPDVQFTTFSYSPREWVIKAEGTTDGRFGFVQKLKKNTALNEVFEIAYPNGQTVKGDRISFTVSGRPFSTTSKPR